MHFPVEYRAASESRFSPPAEVCGTCSDFDAGMLVPVAFCLQAAERCEEYYCYLRGGLRPRWLDELDPWDSMDPEPGPDAMEIRYLAPKTDEMLW
jgi:hypothetical protein